jgi:hypothetical protein
MTCWHCSKELVLNSPVEESHKFYHCTQCDRWYEMFKEKVKINGAVPVKFMEMETSPQLQSTITRLSL